MMNSDYDYDEDDEDRQIAENALLESQRRAETSRPQRLDAHTAYRMSDHPSYNQPPQQQRRDTATHHHHYEDEERGPYPHETLPVPTLTESLRDWVTGIPAHVHPTFRIVGPDTSIANVSLFAHHESSLDDSISWTYLFTLAMLLLTGVFAMLSMFVVCGIVKSYSNGAIFLTYAIPAALLVVVVFGAIIMNWPRRSPYSHQHNNAIFFPVIYFIIGSLFAMVALGFWVTTYQASFFDKYDAAAAPATERPYYYAVYTLISCILVSLIPDLLASLTAQRYPERELYPQKDNAHANMYYLSNDLSEGVTVSRRQIAAK